MGERNILESYDGSPVQNVQGPFSILDKLVYEDVVTMRWRDIAGANLSVLLNTNITSDIAGLTAHAWVIADVEIRASLQGQIHPLKRGQINRYTGPLIYTVPQNEIWDQIIIAARNFNGGSPGVNTGSPVNFTSGAVMDLQVFIQRRMIGEFSKGPKR